MKKTSSGRRQHIRAKTIPRKEMMRNRNQYQVSPEVNEFLERERPRTRGDCINGRRPCLFVGCKHHLYLDVNPETGSIKINFPGLEVWQLEETCALDVADRGGITLGEVGDILNLTRERIRQVEVEGIEKLKHFSGKDDIEDLLEE